jgi:hypothetical protein
MNIIKEATGRPVAKLDQAYAQLSHMAYNLGPDARMPTFANLCEQTRVSKATLDAALGQLEAQGIIMRRQGAGIFVSSQLKRSIALVCDPQFSLEPRLRGFWELIVREARLRVAGEPLRPRVFIFNSRNESATMGRVAPALMYGHSSGPRAGRADGRVPTNRRMDNDAGHRRGRLWGKGPSREHGRRGRGEVGVEALAARGCAVWHVERDVERSGEKKKRA